jgi:hypothetical protein
MVLPNALHISLRQEAVGGHELGQRLGFLVGVVGDSQRWWSGTVAPAELVEARHEKTHADPKAEKQVGKSIAAAAAAFGGGGVGHEMVGLLVDEGGPILNR